MDDHIQFPSAKRSRHNTDLSFFKHEIWTRSRLKEFDSLDFIRVAEDLGKIIQTGYAEVIARYAFWTLRSGLFLLPQTSYKGAKCREGVEQTEIQLLSPEN